MPDNINTTSDIDIPYIQLMMYKTYKESNQVAYTKSKNTLDKIREKISRGRSQYKSFLMD